jgi:hypothetical protein
MSIHSCSQTVSIKLPQFQAVCYHVFGMIFEKTCKKNPSVFSMFFSCFSESYGACHLVSTFGLWVWGGIALPEAMTSREELEVGTSNGGSDCA